MKQFVWIGLHESDTLLSQIYFIFLRVVMYGYLKDYFLINHACMMSFLSRHSHEGGNRGRGNWK
jgi:hypothetical protein